MSADPFPAGSRSLRLADLVGVVEAERVAINRAAAVMARAGALRLPASEAVASVMKALGVPELTARRLAAGLDLDSAVRRLRELATYPGAEPPRLTTDELVEWEASEVGEAGEPRVPPRFLSAVCSLYHVSARDLGYRDYTEADPEPPVAAAPLRPSAAAGPTQHTNTERSTMPDANNQPVEAAEAPAAANEGEPKETEPAAEGDSAS